MEPDMIQLGFLDFSTRLQRIDKAGDPLKKISTAIDWETFRPILEKARKKEKKSAAGAKGFDVILLFKALVLQSLYNLSDEALEFQVLDRYSFSRFLGLHAASKVPAAHAHRAKQRVAGDKWLGRLRRFCHGVGCDRWQSVGGT